MDIKFGTECQSNYININSVVAYPPDIERNGHHCVKDDDVGPEGQETGQVGISAVLPREEGCKRVALLMLPN